MIEQMVDGNGGAVIGKLGHEAADVVGQPELSFLDEQQDRRGGELLGDRPRFEDGRWGDRHVMLEIGGAVGPGQDGRAAARHADRAARAVRTRHRGEDCIDPLLDRLGGSRNGKQ